MASSKKKGDFQTRATVQQKQKQPSPHLTSQIRESGSSALMERPRHRHVKTRDNLPFLDYCTPIIG